MRSKIEQAWHDGVTLEEALEKFSPESIWDELAHIHAHTPPHMVGRPSEPWNPPSGECTVPMRERPQKIRLLTYELRASILKMLSERKLVATGYARPRLRATKLEWIDPRIWETAKIDWKTLVVRSGAFAFDNVRVVLGPDAVEVSTDRRAKGPTTFGPKPKANDIEEAYDMLMARGEVNFTSVRANVSAIKIAVRDRIAATQDLKTFRGCGYDSVRSAIGTKFRRDKAARGL